MSAESEGVGYSKSEIRLDSHVRCVVEVALRIGSVKIDGGRANAVTQCEYSSYRFGGAGSTEHVTGHRFD